MVNESDLEDIVIKSYLELYLRSLNEARPYKEITIYKNRILKLIKRKQKRNQTQ